MESPTESPAIYPPPVDSAATSEPELGLESGIFGTGFLCLGDNTVKHTTSYAVFELRCHKEFLCPALAQLKLYEFSAILCGKQAHGRF